MRKVKKEPVVTTIGKLNVSKLFETTLKLYAEKLNVKVELVSVERGTSKDAPPLFVDVTESCKLHKAI